MSHPPQQDLYVEWGRDDVMPYVPEDVRRVLEVGCGRGGFGRSLRSELGAEATLVAIEPVGVQAEAARHTGAFDTVYTGYFPDALPVDEAPFDLICFNDVLEHILDPWEVLRACHDRLAPDGRVLAAIPNIQHAPTVLRLLRGRWDYEDTGILDRTHVRFFTRATMLELFRSTGYRVETCAGANSVFDEDEYRRWRMLGPLAGDFRWMHFILVARVLAPGASPAATAPSAAPVPGRVPYRRPRPPSRARRAVRRARAAVRGVAR